MLSDLNNAVNPAAVQAAMDVASRFGAGGRTSVLGLSKNVTIRLEDEGLVARATSSRRTEMLVREVEVAKHLATKSAPTVKLSNSIPPGPHEADDWVITFWRYAKPVPVDLEENSTILAAARALVMLHAGFVDYSGHLPSFRQQISGCGKLLDDSGQLSALPNQQRQTLVTAYNRLTARLANHELKEIPLHGDAHIGNAVFTDAGPLWLDFEDVCLGPREWDIARYGESGAFTDVNQGLLDELIILRSVCVATWCWAKVDGSGKRDAAEHHTQLVGAWLSN